MKLHRFNVVKYIVWASVSLSYIYFSSIAIAQIKGEPINVGETINLHSKVLGETRQLSIALPQDYRSSYGNFPVLYLLDGPYHFFGTAGLIHFMEKNGVMPGVIVVAIANTNRTRDLTRSSDGVDHQEKQGYQTTGASGKFIEFITKELQPYIEENFRTQDFRILVGHSYGGLFAVDTLLTEPDSFDAYIAISPALQYNGKRNAKNSKSRFSKPFNSHKFLYVTIADERDGSQEGVDDFHEILKTSAPENLRWGYKSMPEEDHMTVTHRSTYQGLEMLYEPWRLKGVQSLEELKELGGVDSIKARYKKLSKVYGYPIEMPTKFIVSVAYFYYQEKMHAELMQLVESNEKLNRGLTNRIGLWYLGDKDTETAYKILQLNVKRFPNDANLWDSLAEVYKAKKKYKSAIKYFRKAVEIGIKNNDRRISLYKDNVEAMEKLMNNKE